MKENRLFHNNRLKNIQRDFGDLGVFVSGGIAAMMRRDLDPSHIDPKYMVTVFETILERLTGASAPGAPEPLSDLKPENGAHEPGAPEPHGAPEPCVNTISCTPEYNGAPEPGAHAPSGSINDDYIGTAHRQAIHDVTQELGVIEKPESMTDEEALTYLSRKKIFALRVRQRTSELCAALVGVIGSHAPSSQVQEKVPHTPPKEQIKVISRKGGLGENPELIPDEPVIQVKAIDKTNPEEMIFAKNLAGDFTTESKIVIPCPSRLKEIADAGQIPQNFARYFLKVFPGDTGAVDEFSTFVAWHSSKGTKYKIWYRSWVTWVLKKKKGFQKNNWR